jgi:hypothetical protein
MPHTGNTPIPNTPYLSGAGPESASVPHTGNTPIPNTPYLSGAGPETG